MKKYNIAFLRLPEINLDYPAKLHEKLEDIRKPTGSAAENSLLQGIFALSHRAGS